MEPYAAERAMAEIEEILASAKHKKAQAYKATVDAQLAPVYAEHEVQHNWANFDQGVMEEPTGCAGGGAWDRRWQNRNLR